MKSKLVKDLKQATPEKVKEANLLGMDWIAKNRGNTSIPDTVVFTCRDLLSFNYTVAFLAVNINEIILQYVPTTPGSAGTPFLDGRRVKRVSVSVSMETSGGLNVLAVPRDIAMNFIVPAVAVFNGQDLNGFVGWSIPVIRMICGIQRDLALGSGSSQWEVFTTFTVEYYP